MKIDFSIQGLDGLRAALRRLPEDLRREAGVIVHAQAEAAAAAIVANYPTGPTGNLKAHVRVELAGDAVSASARILNTAAHAWIFEHGTGPRQYTGQGRIKTRKNPAGWKAGKSTGAMPEGKVFIPTAIYRRRIMRAALIDLVERAGFKVEAAAA